MLLNDDEQKVVNDYILGEVVYDAVLDQLNIPGDDDDYRALVLGVLKRQTTDHLVFSIWNNMTDEQNRLLRVLFNQTSVTAPGLGHEEIMMEFSTAYPDLLSKVHAGLSEFFKGFIAKFNEISEA